jgi:chromosomal replication initiation ATPase DnaA
MIDVKNAIKRFKVEPVNYFAVAGMKMEKKPKTREQILEAVVVIVCRYVGVKRERLNLKSRKTELVYARQLISYLLYKRGHSLKEIGDFFGGQDHTTVIHSRDKIRDMIGVKTDYVKRDVEFVENQIEERLKYS